MNKPILYATMGFPGSGKTHFCMRLAKEENLFHLNSDRLRLEMFERPTYEPEEHRAVFRCMDYVAGELLLKGISVIYDANLNKVIHRQQARDLAVACGAELVLLWLQAPLEVARQRIATRGDGQDKYFRTIPAGVLESMRRELEEPDNEPHITIDGQAAYGEQRQQLATGLIDARR